MRKKCAVMRVLEDKKANYSHLAMPPAYIGSGWIDLDNCTETVEYKFGECEIAVERVFGKEEITQLLEKMLIEQLQNELLQNEVDR